MGSCGWRRRVIPRRWAGFCSPYRWFGVSTSALSREGDMSPYTAPQSWAGPCGFLRWLWRAASLLQCSTSCSWADAPVCRSSGKLRHHPVTLFSWKFSVGLPWHAVRQPSAGWELAQIPTVPASQCGQAWLHGQQRGQAQHQIHTAKYRFGDLQRFLAQTFAQSRTNFEDQSSLFQTGLSSLGFYKNVLVSKSFQGICDSSSSALSAEPAR